MESLLFTFLFIIIYTFNITDLNEKVIDIYFDEDEFYFLQKDSISKGSFGISNYSITKYYFQDSEIMNSYSAFTKTDKGIFVVCTNNYLIAFYKLNDDNLILENKVDYNFKDDKNKQYNITNIPILNCSISIFNQYIIVSHISKINFSSLYIFKFNDKFISFEYSKNYIIENTLKKSYLNLKDVLIYCFNSDNSQINLICVYLYQQPHYFVLNTGKDIYHDVIIKKNVFESFIQERINYIINKNNYIDTINTKFNNKSKRNCDENICNSDKPYYIKELNECVNNCTDTYYKFFIEELKICRDSCEGDYPLTSINENKKECVNKCPENKPYYDLHNMECFAECDEKYEFIINEKNECVEKCNETYPFMINGKNICYSKCPDNYYFIEGQTQCIESCPSDSKYFVSEEKKMFEKLSK